MNPEKFVVDGIAYLVDSKGVVRQENREITQKYNIDYVKQRYDTLPDRGRGMSMLRAGYIIGALGYVPHKILDIGYGNGGFLAIMREYGSKCYGYDITGYPIPEGCTSATWGDVLENVWSLICMFDSLEHMPNLEFIGALRTSIMVITAPWKPQDGNFRSWKHRRVGEHIYHFDPNSLDLFMQSYGYHRMQYHAIEDIIRKDGKNNTFTAIFQKC